ncbi:MAG: M28 family peptidase [Paludibacteraceae bacterium]|nr:M28 family peptidase [Paludibacteraceae bacterium]
MYIEKQMAFGPRVPNGASHMQCAVWLIDQLKACGAEVELQKGVMSDYRGNNQQIYNIIGHFYTPQTALRPRILLGAHYDTRPWCDEEEDYSDRFYNVPGANDGASGVGVLLEVARQLGIQLADSNFRTPVDIVFFDCEDMGTPRFYTGPEREDTWCLGSQLWAMNNTKPYQFGIVLDMVGAPNAIFPQELLSMQYAQNYQEQIWRSAAKLGYSSLFSTAHSYPITDDHYYVNEIAGIPCVDVIHYDMRSSTGFPSWWHTRNDDMTNISKATLQAVGEVVMAQL